jgi:hypothetical protein
MKTLQQSLEKYRNIIENINLEQFNDEIKNIVKLNLSIWKSIAEINNLTLNRVLIKEAMEITEGLEHFEYDSLEVPDIGKINISNSKGTVIFVDISKSTKFLENKNYTGFVIFNSYISLVKTYVRLSGGEFLEHTGDGSMIFYKNIDLIDNYERCKYLEEIEENPLYMLFYIGYLLQINAENQDLLSYFCSDKNNGVKCYSLIHIGASYGKILDVNLGDMRKIISDTVWKAANNCKKAPRTFIKNAYNRSFIELPIEI